MIGPIINGVSIILGSCTGAFFGDKIPRNLRRNLPMVFGCASMGLGIAMITKAITLPAVILSLLIGTIIGELLNLERFIQRFANRARTIIENFLPAAHQLSHEEFMEKFVAMLVLFCASGTGIFGAMNEGMVGDPSLLIIKSFLDLFTAAIFASSLGYTLAVAAIPQFCIQLSLFLLAKTILPLTTPTMIADFSAVGGLLMFATGFRICNIQPFPIANMLPALFLAMPISALWTMLF